MYFKLLAISICVCLQVVGQQNTGGIQFEQGLTWQQVKEKARAERKYIFLDVFASWCLPCREMDKLVYTNDTVARLVNDRFLSVKLQMDTTAHDNAGVKSWYQTAKEIEAAYPIQGYPSFLFFNPEGNLVHRGLGYKDVSAFIQLAKQALSPQNELYFASLEQYRKGEKVSQRLDSLAIYVKTLGEKDLAKKIAEQYLEGKTNGKLMNRPSILFVLDLAQDRKRADSLFLAYKSLYLNQLSESELLKKETLSFINRFSPLITSSDKIVGYWYNKPDLLDSLANGRGWSEWEINALVAREELDPMVKTGHPDWNQLQQTIKKKYGKLNADRLVKTYQLDFYKERNNWPAYTATLVKLVDRYGPYGYKHKEIPEEIDFNLNNNAWDIFEHSTNKKELEKALQWSEKAIALCNNANKPNWMDTRANLLYKLGRVKEAIALETRIVELVPESKSFRATLDKMKKNRPTW